MLGHKHTLKPSVAASTCQTHRQLSHRPQPHQRRPTTRLAVLVKADEPNSDHLPSYKLPNGLTVRHTSTPAEVVFLYDEVYQQQQYLQHGVALQQGGTVIDVGANIGLFSMLAAEAVGPSGCVVCVEPAPQTAAALAFNLQQHAQWCSHQGKQVGRTVVLSAAVTDDPDASQAQFTVYKGAAGWSTLSPDDAEVVSNMQSYVRSLLKPTANVQRLDQQQQQQQQPGLGSTPDSQGWSLPQQALVWCARQLSRIPGATGMTDAMVNTYVRLAMLRGAETVTVPTATVSCIIEQQQLNCVALLKVDVERAELQVLQGIQPQHWPIIQQVAMEVHDIDGRLSQVVSLLEHHGFSSLTTEQPTHLQGTDLHNLYATRTGRG